MKFTSWVHVAVALMGCILAFGSPTCHCSGSNSEADSRRGSISASDRMYLESLSLQGTLTFDNTTASAKDWGQLRRFVAPAGVLQPASVEDIATVVGAVGRLESDLTVAARGLGSSVGGQSQVPMISQFSLCALENHSQPSRFYTVKIE